MILPANYARAGIDLAVSHFTIHDGKPRNISAAPFRDRVVHHALMQIVEPLLESVFLDNSWACRKRKGTHAAVRQYQRWLGGIPMPSKWMWPRILLLLTRTNC